jgi:hypothetical protein
MAIVTAPLFSLGASGSIAKTLTYFPWKGLRCVRQRVVPANPNSSAQQVQRGYFGDAVDLVHAAQVEALNPLNALDVAAYALKGTTRSSPRTWFNEAVKNYIDQNVAGAFGIVFRGATSTPGAGQVAITLKIEKQSGAGGSLTAGNILYGSTKSALVNSAAATIGAEAISYTIASLGSGERVYWKFVSTAHDDFDGTESGIYTDVAT